MTTAQLPSGGFDAASLMAYERQPSSPPPNPVDVQNALAVPPIHQQVSGQMPPPGTPPAGVDPAEYKEFLAFKASKAAANAPAPATAPTPAPTPEPAKVQTPGEVNESVSMADAARGSDPVLDSMLTVFDHGAKGLDRSRALGNALSRSDASLVDVAYIREVAGDQADALIAVAKSIVTHATASVAAVESAILTAAGGQASWDAAAAAFNKTAQPGMKSYVASEMGSGNRDRILAAAALVTEHAKSSGLVPDQGQHITPGGGGQPGNGSALSKAEFKTELAKLDKRDRNYDTLTKALFERRVRGANAGL